MARPYFRWIGFQRRKPNLPGTPERLGAHALGFGILQTPPTRYPPARRSRLLRLSNPNRISRSRGRRRKQAPRNRSNHLLPAPARAQNSQILWVSIVLSIPLKKPLIGVLRAHAMSFGETTTTSLRPDRRDDPNSHRRDPPPAPPAEQKKRHVRPDPRQFPSSARAATSFSSGGACRSAPQRRRLSRRPDLARPESVFPGARECRREIRSRRQWRQSRDTPNSRGPSAAPRHPFRE